MAVDEALLETAASLGVPTLRFYQWQEPTMSLGYFQEYADRLRHAASAGCPTVRRASGGGAIMHDRELTYSLAVPEGTSTWSPTACGPIGSSTRASSRRCGSGESRPGCIRVTWRPTSGRTRKSRAIAGG